MELTFDKLIKFDLVDELEKSLFKGNSSAALVDFVSAMQKIQSVDQFIKESPSYPRATNKIIRSELVSAIGATLAIEGTKIKDDEIEESFRKASLNEALQRKEQEAENSRKVYEFIIDLVNNTKAEFIYEEAMIKQIHKYFTENMNYLGNTPGAYRSNFIATFGDPRKSGLCRTGNEVDTAMQNFVNWLNKKEVGILSSNTIVKAIMAHYYLTEIHPFPDGNGRTARALESLVLYVNGINSYCFWSLANFWSNHRDQYIIHLGNIRNTSNAWDFLLWGMKGYLNEIERIKASVLKKVKQLMLMDYTKYLVDNKKEQKVKIYPRVIDVLRLLVRQEGCSFPKFLSSPEIKALYKNLSASTKSRDFNKMLDLGLIRLNGEKENIFIEPNFQILDRLNYNV